MTSALRAVEQKSYPRNNFITDAQNLLQGSSISVIKRRLEKACQWEWPPPSPCGLHCQLLVPRLEASNISAELCRVHKSFEFSPELSGFAGSYFIRIFDPKWFFGKPPGQILNPTSYWTPRDFPVMNIQPRDQRTESQKVAVFQGTFEGSERLPLTSLNSIRAL